MKTSNVPVPEWSASYWQADKHGVSWENVKGALQRDWEQTRADFEAGGRDLNQQLSDTLKQASGNVPVPLPGVPNPAAWDQVETSVRYGFGAHEQYGAQFEDWSDSLEVKLSSEWDEASTGKPFREVRPWVRHGWSVRPGDAPPVR